MVSQDAVRTWQSGGKKGLCFLLPCISYAREIWLIFIWSRGLNSAVLLSCVIPSSLILLEVCHQKRGREKKKTKKNTIGHFAMLNCRSGLFTKTGTTYHLVLRYWSKREERWGGKKKVSKREVQYLNIFFSSAYSINRCLEDLKSSVSLIF